LSNLQAIREAFERLANRYDEHAALEQEVCRRLLEKTAFRRNVPATVLDLGCGTGFGAGKLKQEFRKAQVIGLDTSMAMLSQLRSRSGMFKPLRGVCGDIGALPFATRSADMLVANLASYWCPEPMVMFAEFRRVLRPDGMLLFSTFGPGTMRELKAAWSFDDAEVELPDFPDLVDVGNALVAAGFREPVMDMEIISLSYPDLNAMFQELEATGTSLLVRGWDRRHFSRDRMEQTYCPFIQDGKYPLSFEIIYGVAFGPREGQPVKTPAGDVVTFSVEALRRNRKVP
jgi:malonyl-CoA O-methyltransferase